MLSIGAREKNKMKLLWPCFGQVERKKTGRVTEERTEDMMSKCQMGENYV